MRKVKKKSQTKEKRGNGWPVRKAKLTAVAKDVQAVKNELEALSRKTEKIMKAVDKASRAKGYRSKMAAKKQAPAKKPKAVTATDKVLKIIKRSKKGVDAPTLIKKTGFEDKKVRNILMRASRQGKIKRVKRGTYVDAE